MKSVNTTGEDDNNDPFSKEPQYIPSANQFDSQEEFSSMPEDFSIKDKYNYLKAKFNRMLEDKN